MSIYNLTRLSKAKNLFLSPKYNTAVFSIHNTVQSYEEKLVDDFGSDVFGSSDLQAALSAESFKEISKSMQDGTPIKPGAADHVKSLRNFVFHYEIAQALKNWAVKKGASHYTHWFQPFTGTTAEKHDSFLSLNQATRDIKLKFSGKDLIKGEPDASSFPNGGLRATHEARGYTAWDMSFPFLKRGKNGVATLFIPTAFCSWTGESLDFKTPLLKSNDVLSQKSLELLKLLSQEQNNSVTSVAASLGIEQEFFLINEEDFRNRPDLVASGRTVVGASPSKGQELDDHYFGSKNPKILDIISEAEIKLWKLGVPLTTRHQEVAPSQYEVAPIFEKANLASDHNLLTMQVIKETAQSHGMVALFHEKPFQGINGSGKHLNWSIDTQDGQNMFNPGETPEVNTRFLLFLAATIRAVHLHGDLLRTSVVTPGNDHRLGANEAPPAIMSIHLGTHLEKVVESIIKSEALDFQVSDSLKIMVEALPAIPRDSTDRNRTSPFAFTGNKFEFRACGSSQNAAKPCLIMNTVLAESLDFITNEIKQKIKSGSSKETAVGKVLQETFSNHQNVIFGGNNYSEQWVEEATKVRKLHHFKTAVEAIHQYSSDKNVDLFKKMNIFTKDEVLALQEIEMENYLTALGIEASCLINMTSTGILPAAFAYQEKISNSILATEKIGSKVNLNESKKYLAEFTNNVESLITALEHFKKVDISPENVPVFKEKMAETRRICDNLESSIPSKEWPFPSFQEILLQNTK